jgi:hypothetical protein
MPLGWIVYTPSGSGEVISPGDRNQAALWTAGHVADPPSVAVTGRAPVSV